MVEKGIKHDASIILSPSELLFSLVFSRNKLLKEQLEAHGSFPIIDSGKKTNKQKLYLLLISKMQYISLLLVRINRLANI
jgi:hypothetical protein